MQVAQTILSQLGGNKFIAMTGASNLGGTENSLSFKIGKNSKKVTHVRIELNANDLYDVKFFNIRGTNIKTVSEFEDVYSENLVELFESETGLFTKLF